MSARPASSVSARWTPRSVRAGAWTITALSDGYLRLDGGSMWGVVPRALWSAMTPPDADHTILLALRPFLARRDDLVVVIEGGVGGRWDARHRAIYKIERDERVGTLAGTLRALGLAPADVTHVVASHAHFDHVGALVVADGDALAPLFPNARHRIPRVEVEAARAPDPVRRASYRADDVLPLERAGLLDPFDAPEDGVELLPGLRAYDASGHSDGVCVLTLDEDAPEGGAIFWADVVPTTHHVQPPYIMAYDIDQTRSYRSRSRWLARAADAGWTGLFYHDADHAFARVRRADPARPARERYAVDPIEA